MLTHTGTLPQNFTVWPPIIYLIKYHEKHFSFVSCRFLFVNYQSYVYYTRLTQQ